MLKKKNVTYRVWRDSPKGSDTARSFRSKKGAASYALRLHKKGQLNSINVATGRSLLSERNLTKPERMSFKKAFIKLGVKKKK